MISLSISDNIEEKLMEAIDDGIEKLIREKIGSIRDPETGEFPTIVKIGKDYRVEASPPLMSIILNRLQDDDEFSQLANYEEKPMPKVFLSHAVEDKKIAKRVANYLVKEGIETWLDEWSMKAGDSLVQKIEEGIEDCTHFVALFTKNSIQKDWFRAEVDAALNRGVKNKCQFIPLRYSLNVDELSTLVQSRVSPEIKEKTFKKDMKSLTGGIYGTNKKPPLGNVPEIVENEEFESIDYSRNAMAVAKFFVENSKTGRIGNPQVTCENLANDAGLSIEDTEFALHELSSFIGKNQRLSGYTSYHPEEMLFVEFDEYWKGWVPKEYALTIAMDINNNENLNNPQAICELHEWDARRINPAIIYMICADIIRDAQTLNSPFRSHSIVAKQPNLRIFIKTKQIAEQNANLNIKRKP